MMRDNLYRDMDESIYESLKRMRDYDDKKFIVLSGRRRKYFLSEMENIKECYNIRIVKHLALLCFDRDADIASEAVKHIKRIIDRLEMKEFLFFAEHFRSIYYDYDVNREIAKAYRKSDQKDIEELFGEDAKYLISVLTLHSNGYVREDSLRQLSSMDDGFKMRFIMVRLNDWVKGVRVAAKEELKKNMEIRYLDSIIECIPIMERMKVWTRDHHEKILDIIEEFIKDNTDYDDMLRAYKRTNDNAVKRKLFDFMMEIRMDESLIVDIGIKSKDIVVLKRSIEKIDDVLSRENGKRVFVELVKNKNAMCRIKAVDVLGKVEGVDFNEHMIPMIYDKSHNVRSYSRSTLSGHGAYDFRGMYLWQLDKENYNTCAVISGIRETGRKEDAIRLIEYIDDDRLKVRKTALHALYTLDSDRGVEYAVEKLKSKEPGESKNARKCLENEVYMVDPDEVFKAYKTKNYENHVYMNLIELTCCYSKWIALRCLLKMLNESNEHFQKIINSEIGSWSDSFNKSFISPSKLEIESIKKLFMSAGGRLSSRNSLVIGQILKTY